MLTRKIRDAKDLSTDELIYFNSHAKATYMSSGKNVENTINRLNAKTNAMSVFELIDHGDNNGVYMIKPNILNKWGMVTDLTISFEEELIGYTNEYMFQFTSGVSPTVLSLPSNILWANNDIPNIESGYIYQVNILNNLAVYMKFQIPFDELYPKFPLYFEAIEPMTVSFSTNDIEYSFDNNTWTVLPTNTSTPTINAGKIIYFKASGLTPNSTNGIGTFSCTNKCNVGGNIMSMVYGDNFIDKNEISDYQFYRLFYNNKNLIDASKLVLSTTTLANSCYSNMFYGCTSLTTAPELPATTLTDSCYRNIFAGCSRLNKITMLATDISAYNCLYYWVDGVASTGTFIKNPNMSSLPTGDSGIPNGWTVIDY